tara:strand:- start:462 stop:590 length:129 start_codon:yes stop_codon:yes gene_type:complete
MEYPLLYVIMSKLLLIIAGGACALIPVYLLSLILQNALKEEE